MNFVQLPCNLVSFSQPGISAFDGFGSALGSRQQRRNFAGQCDDLDFAQFKPRLHVADPILRQISSISSMRGKPFYLRGCQTIMCQRYPQDLHRTGYRRRTRNGQSRIRSLDLRIFCDPHLSQRSFMSKRNTGAGGIFARLPPSSLLQCDRKKENLQLT